MNSSKFTKKIIKNKLIQLNKKDLEQIEKIKKFYGLAHENEVFRLALTRTSSDLK